MKKFLQLGLILVFGAGSNFSALAQTRVYPDLTVTISSNNTDYMVNFDYSAISTVNCEYYRRHTVTIFRDWIDESTDIVYAETADSKLSTAHIELPVGPNSIHKYALQYREYSHSVYSCNEYAWSGFKKNNAGVWEPNPATSEEDRDSWYNLNRYSVNIYANTSSIKSPTNIQVSDQAYFDKIVLSWTKGSDIPDSSLQILSNPPLVKLQYRIYKGTTASNMALVAIVPAGTHSWTDNTIEPNNQFYYCVTTYTTGWGGNESPHTSAYARLGKAKAFSVTASDSLYTNRVKVTWQDLSSFAEGIRIERSVPGGTKEELDILSKNATAYNDMDAIPFYRYTYYITPIQSGRTFPTLSDQGFTKPNGTISGYVKSLLNAGVNGVKVCATLLTTSIPDGAFPKPAGGYCATTDMDGYFEIRNIYYYDGAEFSIVPSKGSPPHIFTPTTITRKLDLNSKTSSGVNFTDQSVFTVGGKVIFPTSTAVVCGVPDVEIKLNGQSRGIFTKSDGSWTFALQDEGTYTFKPVFLNHRFEDAYQQTETTLPISADNININFTDKQVDEIKVKVQAGCGNPVTDGFVKAKLLVTSAGNCYNETVETDANGLLTIGNLPARVYDIQVTDLDPHDDNVMEQIGNKPIKVDLTVRDTTEVISTHEEMTIVPGYTTVLPNGAIIVTPPDTTYKIVTDTVRSVVIPVA